MWKVALQGHVGHLAFDVHIETTCRVIVVVGENGAGKSTLLRAIAGAELPVAGEVAVNGRVLVSRDQMQTLSPEHRMVGHMPQQGTLFPHLTVLQNVAFGPRARGATRAQAQQRARSALQQMQVEALASQKPHTLSGGESQRVALARALAADAQVLLLDEPLSPIDLGARAALRTLIVDHMRTRPSLVVTHDVRDVTAFAADDGWVVELAAGKVVAQGSLSDLALRPKTNFLSEILGQ